MPAFRLCHFSDPQTLQGIEKGISHFEVHYVGSAKILGGVGKGLAEAGADLKQPKN